MRLARIFQADGVINRFRRGGDADAMDEVGRHDYFLNGFYEDFKPNR
jgi:hypothetical protein